MMSGKVLEARTNTKKTKIAMGSCHVEDYNETF
jgi:hypothetical protein